MESLKENLFRGESWTSKTNKGIQDHDRIHGQHLEN